MRTARGFSVRVGLVGLTLLCAAILSGQTRSALTHYHDGEILYEQGDLIGALRAFERAYAEDPKAHRGDRIGMHFEDYDPAFQIGRIHARLGEFEQAQRYFARCAAGRYTENSQNAEEFSRWRAVVDRAVLAARARTPAQPAAPTATAPALEVPPSSERRPSPPSSSVLPPAAASERTRPVSPTRTASPTPERTPVMPEPAIVAGDLRAPTALPLATPTVSPPGPSPTPAPNRNSVRGVLLAVVSLLVLAAIALGTWSLRGRRVSRAEDGTVNIGRYGISSLLGVGSASFVYEARDRKTGEVVALRIRRPDASSDVLERFEREAAALERLSDGKDAGLAPGLIQRSSRTVSGRVIDYLVLELLSGRTLLDLSRNARRRLEPDLCLEILRTIADALRQARAAGLAHPELTAEDIFLIDPVPLNAGNPIALKTFGLIDADSGSRSSTAGLIRIALEIFRGRAGAWEDEGTVPSEVPEPLRAFLLRLQKEPLPTLEEFCSVLESCRTVASGTP